jgi:hypothetical protein
LLPSNSLMFLTTQKAISKRGRRNIDCVKSRPDPATISCRQLAG